MTTLLPVAWRLARAGGTYRLAAQAGVNVLGGLLLALSLAVPQAVLSDGASTDELLTLVALLTIVLLPLAILLVASGRLSGATRDRRLAALRVLGLGPWQTRAVGATEAGLLAGAGALAGVGLAAAVAPLVDLAVHAAPERADWFVAPLRVTVAGSTAVVVGLVLLAGLASIAGTWRLTGNPLAQRSTSTRRTPAPWGFAPFGAGAAIVAWGVLGLPGTIRMLYGGEVVLGVARVADIDESPVPVLVVLGAGLVLLTVGVVTLPGVLTAWVAGRLARSRSTAAVLAGGGVQTEPASVPRIVAGVAVVVLLATCAAGYLGALTGDATYQKERAQVAGGPVTVTVMPPELPDTGGPAATAQPTVADLDSLRAVPEVLAALPDLIMARGPDGQRMSGLGWQPFVGTCAELRAVMVVDGCRDDTAARIVGRASDPPPTETIELATFDAAYDLVRTPVRLDGEPIRADDAATAARWGHPGVEGWTEFLIPYGYFVPVSLPGVDTIPMEYASVVIEGGPAAWQRVREGITARGFDMGEIDRDTFDEVELLRAQLLVGVAGIVGVAGLGIVITAIDRVRARRRTLARLVALGVPARTLLAAQAWQVLLPLAIAVLLAGGVGLAVVGAVARSADLGVEVVSAGMPLLLAVVGIVVVLVPLLTLPAATTRLTPELLREE